MPNPVNAIKHEQWQSCDRCGRLFPMGSLTKQKGILVCTMGCFDKLEVERREYEIERTMGSGVDQEGVDTRVIDRGFFEGFDDQTF